MLTFPEELLVLLVQERSGTFLPIGKYTLQRALISGALMDLALNDRIDTDPNQLMVINSAPAGASLLNSVLERIVSTEEIRDTAAWIETLTEEQGSGFHQRALANLVNRGVLEEREETRFLVFRVRRYQVVDTGVVRFVKKRVTNVLFSDDVPDPRDIALICLVDACGLLQTVFGEAEIEMLMPRIEQLRKMDLIGREMTARLAIWKLGYDAEA